MVVVHMAGSAEGVVVGGHQRIVLGALILKWLGHNHWLNIAQLK